MTPAVLMGDPEFFSVKAGPNPHTRQWWGGLKKVDRTVAIRQWNAFKNQIEAGHIQVHVVPPVAELPGLVYPANAGVLYENVFYPANLLPARAKEREQYEACMKRLGYEIHSDAFRRWRFEGEADFFPWANRWIFTHGRIERQRFIPAWKFPFYKRVYGFRSERSALEELSGIVRGQDIVDLELCDERYYHGDTCLCSFGPRREFLMAYLPALTESSRRKITGLAADRLISLSDEDAASYAANAYSVCLNKGPHLFMTVSASENLKRQIAALGVQVVEVEVSEFLKKGGGSVKCMVFDLAGGRTADIHVPFDTGPSMAGGTYF